MGRARDSELEGAVELPEMPEITNDGAVNFADWLYEVEQAVGGLSDRASRWFGMYLSSAREAYELYQMSDPLSRLTLEGLMSFEMRSGRGSNGGFSH